MRTIRLLAALTLLALGLDHHRKYGCLSSTPKYPSASEIAGLRRYYERET